MIVVIGDLLGPESRIQKRVSIGLGEIFAVAKRTPNVVANQARFKWVSWTVFTMFHLFLECLRVQNCSSTPGAPWRRSVVAGSGSRGSWWRGVQLLAGFEIQSWG
jgi:hypothetical protein